MNLYHFSLKIKHNKLSSLMMMGCITMATRVMVPMVTVGQLLQENISITSDGQAHTATYYNVGMFTTQPSLIEISNVIVDDDRAFYNNYLHATMVGWPYLFSLNGISGDAITDGIDINIYGRYIPRLG